MKIDLCVLPAKMNKTELRLSSKKAPGHAGAIRRFSDVLLQIDVLQQLAVLSPVEI